MTSTSTNKILNAPELHISIFAFVLNIVWKLLQMDFPWSSGHLGSHEYSLANVVDRRKRHPDTRKSVIAEFVSGTVQAKDE